MFIKVLWLMYRLLLQDLIYTEFFSQGDKVSLSTVHCEDVSYGNYFELLYDRSPKHDRPFE